MDIIRLSPWIEKHMAGGFFTLATFFVKISDMSREGFGEDQKWSLEKVPKVSLS